MSAPRVLFVMYTNPAGFPPIGRADLPGTFQVKIESPFVEAARTMGISDDQLKKDMAEGKSLADIARAHNVDPKVVADALKAKRRSELDAAVAAGKLPKDQVVTTGPP